MIIDVKESIRQIMSKARFYYKDKNAPMPNRPNHIGSTIIICYDGKVLLESRADSDRWAFLAWGRPGKRIKKSVLHSSLFYLVFNDFFGLQVRPPAWFFLKDPWIRGSGAFYFVKRYYIFG